MNLQKFYDLCAREWDGVLLGGFRGEVAGLHLTDDSYGELAADIIISGSFSDDAKVRPGERQAERRHLPGYVLNPITRGAVRIQGWCCQ